MKNNIEVNAAINKSRSKAKVQKDLHFYKHKIPKTCATCKHWAKMITEEPCFCCNNSYHKWEKI